MLKSIKLICIVFAAPLRRGGIASRGGANAGGRGGRNRAPAPTAEELDAELDAYVNDMK